MTKIHINFQEVNIVPDLSVNNYEIAKLKDLGFQTNSVTSADKNANISPKNTEIKDEFKKSTLLEDIQSSSINRELFSSFIISKNKQNEGNNVSVNQTAKSQRSNKIAITLTSAGVILLGALTLVHDKKGLNRLREFLSQKMAALQTLKDHKKLKALGKAKLAVTKFAINILNYAFSLDKIKDFALLRSFESLGKFGKFVVNGSKISLSITEKTTLSGLYQALKTNATSVSKSVDKVLSDTKNLSNDQEKLMVEKLGTFLNGDKEDKGLSYFVDELISGLGNRVKSLKGTIQRENIDCYREKYYPKSFKLSEFKRKLKVWKEFLFSSSEEGKDVLRENWSKTEEILIKNINETGANEGKIKNVGQAKEEMANIVKEMEELYNKPDCSNEFRNLTKQVKNLNQKINNPQNATNPISFETSGKKYAGRVLDLFAGGGMTEILVPPVAGALITYSTLKDTKREDRKEKFIRSGGPALIGGLAGWMITSNLLAVSGATGMLVGLGTAWILDILSSQYLKHMRKTQNAQPENKNTSIDKNFANHS